MTAKLVLSTVLAIACFCGAVLAQNITVDNIIATNFVANDTIVELTIPPAFEGVSFLIVWDNGKIHEKPAFARAGTHSYDLRNHPAWHGRMRGLGVTIPDAKGRIKTPAAGDEIDIFLEPERISPTVINFGGDRTFYTYSATAWLWLLLGLCTVILIVLRKKRPLTALALALLVTLGIREARTVYDHAMVAYNTENYQKELHGMFPLAGVKTFSGRAAELIGSSSWSQESVEGFQGTFLRYNLAEKRYVPTGSALRPDFRINRNPNAGPAVWDHNNYFLRKTTP